MEVILLERIERLGTMGQTVKVRPGFARNYLLPNKKALRATKANLELFEKQRAELEAQNAAERAKAEALATKMEGLTLVVIRQASEMGQLFGSVTARDVVEVAIEAGHQMVRNQVQIDNPIKTLGLFTIKIKLHPEVTTTVTVNVARSPEEATAQADKAKAATAKASKKAEEAAVLEAPAAEEPAKEEAAAPEAAEVTEDKPKKARKTKKADAEKAEDKAEDKEAPKAKKPAKKAKKTDAE
ncbi:MAG: 50S ribosomal protein L9 [Alphaproteobacteria bacterium]|nr:50S ribosomal protein L9 [Alphaproteobacteria bacterium]